MAQVTKGEGLRILANAMHDMKFARTPGDAEKCYDTACKYTGLTNAYYCCSRRSCNDCRVQKEYNKQLQKIAFMRTNMKRVTEEM